MKGIGVFGGTFDPVHYGHLRTALEVKDIFELDHVRLIPCSQPPHRETPLSTPEMRFQMLKLAVENQADLVIDRRELDRDGYSFMVDTLQSLRDEKLEIPLLLFIGTDAFKGLKTWYHWEKLFDLAHIVVITRPGYSCLPLADEFSARLIEDKQGLNQTLSGCLYFQAVTQLDISATAIRGIIKTGKNPGYLLPKQVVDLIKQNKLYLRNL